MPKTSRRRRAPKRPPVTSRIWEKMDDNSRMVQIMDRMEVAAEENVCPRSYGKCCSAFTFFVIPFVAKQWRPTACLLSARMTSAARKRRTARLAHGIDSKEPGASAGRPNLSIAIPFDSSVKRDGTEEDNKKLEPLVNARGLW